MNTILGNVLVISAYIVCQTATILILRYYLLHPSIERRRFAVIGGIGTGLAILVFFGLPFALNRTFPSGQEGLFIAGLAIVLFTVFFIGGYFGAGRVYIRYADYFTITSTEEDEHVSDTR